MGVLPQPLPETQTSLPSLPQMTDQGSGGLALAVSGADHLQARKNLSLLAQIELEEILEEVLDEVEDFPAGATASSPRERR